ncbi:aspartate aminotransferase [Deinobacterium chartae]|uniref:Aminotransferase n=1 Tax=Deinobacterium chartae TaxID=521158 RepID=A0A841I250_9DEIO|nr:pyridoxal phosphate-dependent aminotransferase [Deinobacterium chartae]MBB6099767.1 aspartate aminotransferase [Deinobacterium chartae]
MSLKLSHKVRSLKPSSTVAVAARALELKRQGVDVISLAAGEPDFDTPEHVRRAALEAIEAGRTRYTQVQGIPELREAISSKLARENGLSYAPEQITVTNGGKQALFNAFLALLDPGDEVIIPAPFWVSYPEIVSFAGGVPVFVETRAENGYALDPEAVRAAVSERTVAIVLNSPSNPTGVVYPEEVVRAVAELAAERGLLVVSDEIYEHIIYDARHVSAARFAPDNVLVVNGASKAYAMTGWRLGYAAGPRPLINAMNALQGQSTSNASSVSQWAAIAALEDSREFIAMAVGQFRARRDRIVAGLNALGLATPTPEGAFYVMADTRSLHQDELKAAQLLLDQARIAAVPGTDFHAPGRVRLSYATSMAQIDEALARIGKLVGVQV